MNPCFYVLKGQNINSLKWKELVDNSSYANPFQTEQFYSFCISSKHVQGFAYAIKNDQNNYVALCVVTVQKEKNIKAFFSRRAIVYGGPVLSDDCSGEALQLLLQTLEKELRKKAIYIEIRNYNSYKKFHSIYEQFNWSYTPYLNIKVDLDNKDTLDQLLLSFKYNRRREIKLSLKAGLTYKEANKQGEVVKVYSLLNDLYKKQVGLPIPSLSYFTDLWNIGLLKAFIVNDRSKIVGGAFCIIHNNIAIYTYYYCGLRNYKPKVYPTHLAVLAALEYGINNRLKYLDFMGAGTPNQDYGVRRYKKEFGGEVVEEGRYYKVMDRLLYWLGGKAITVLKKIKF